MAATITKILLRQGTDITRRTGGGIGVVLNQGEPGFCLDTGRLYVGDGATVGGKPIGTKNHGVVAVLTGSDPNYAGYDVSTYNTLTSNGADAGDIIYDTNTSAIYYISSKTSTSAVPVTSAFTRFNLIGTLSSANGIVNNKIAVGTYGPVIAYYSLDPIYFTVAGALVQIPTNFAVIGQTNLASITINGNTIATGITNNGSITTTGTLSAGGVIYAGAAAGYNSNNWFTTWSYVNSNSASINATGTAFRQLSPFPWISDSTANTVVSTFSTTTKVGINTTNTTIQGLVIKGATTTTNALSVYGNIVATGDVTAFSTSDERLKTNIEPISNALSIIDNIEGVNFDWKCDWRTGPDVGVIAQRVEEVFPRVVITRDDGYKAVNYEGIIPLLIQCIKVLKAKIKE